VSRRTSRRVHAPRTDGGGRGRKTLRALLGVLALQGALTLLIVLAADPPPKPVEVKLALHLPPLEPMTRREVVVAIKNALPPEPATSRWWSTPILAVAPTPAYLADLMDGAGAPIVQASRVDALIAPRVPTRRAPERPAARAATRASVAPDRTHPAPRGIDSLNDAAFAPVALADQLEAGPLALPFEIARGRATEAADATDRLIAAPAPHVAIVRVAMARSAPRVTDRLSVSARATVLRDETAWSAAAPAWSAEPLRPELLPTARPSPAVLLARWLPELDSPAHSAPLKTEFVRQVLPLIMQVNEEILRQRERTVALAPEVEAGKPLSEADQRVVAELLVAARLDAWDTDEMLLRLDAVPLSMALAQAGLESGWGRSRPAREDNALFGQMAFAPASLPKVQSFADVLETVQAYACNLNTHRAYGEFRRRRAALRARGDTLDGHTLAAFIQRYSERGPHYVEAIRHLMRINNLSLLDATVIDAAFEDTLGRMLDGAAGPTPDDIGVVPATIEP
jgi:Bax protein